MREARLAEMGAARAELSGALSQEARLASAESEAGKPRAHVAGENVQK